MSNFFRLKLRPWELLAVAGWLMCLFTIMAFVAQLWWAFDLTAHFRVQYAVGLSLLALLFSLVRRWKLVVTWAVMGVLNWGMIVPHGCFGRVPTGTPTRTLRALLLNVHTENQRFDLVEAYIRKSDADLVVLEEVNDEWIQNSRLRNEQLELVARFFANRQGPQVLLGDLNTTPWSPHFRKLLRDSGLTDSARGFGWQTTWPALFWPLRIAIDHCLISRDLRVVARQVGSYIGSDHLPLLVEIAVE